MTTSELLNYALSYGIPLACLLMFIRELLVSYFVRAKFESSVGAVLKGISEKVSRIESIVDHGADRIGADIPKTSEISRLVTSLRAKLVASRAYVLRFHDGSAFSTNTPVWKVSLTHESTDSAIVSIAERTKDILIANVVQIVAPVFDGSELSDGIIALKDGSDTGIGAFRVDADAVSSPAIKGFLLSRGIKHMLYAPIVNLDGKPVAMFCVDYAAEMPEFLTDEYAAKELLDAASILSSLMC